jgi:hypothetical protein
MTAFRGFLVPIHLRLNNGGSEPSTSHRCLSPIKGLIQRLLQATHLLRAGSPGILTLM